MNEQNKSLYWGQSSIEEIASKIDEKYSEYKAWMTETGYSDRIQTSYNRFYGFDNNGTLRITRDSNETAQINVNHFKSLIKRLHVLCTENKVAFQPRAKSSDTKSQVESDLAKGIVEYYSDEKAMSATLSEAVLTSLIMLEAWVHCEWSLSEGYELTTDGQQIIKTGDQTFKTYSPFDVARSTTDVHSPWVILRQKVNKYDEAALHPEFESEILSDSVSYDATDLNYQSSQTNQDDDYCYKYILYHARTPSMPYGRHTEIIANQVVADGQLKYEKIPLFNLKAGSVLSTSFADSPSIDLLPLQEALNAILSGTLTNNLNNTVQLIYSADPNLTTRKLSDGQTLVTSASPPQALNLTGSSAENFKMIDLLVQHQQLLSGINDIARGAGNPSVKTSGGQALYIATALQFISDLQKNYAALASEVATCLVNNIQKFASEEMTAYITGSSKKGQIKKFKAQDLMDVERISVDLGNPLTQSLAGRRELLTDMMQMGAIKDPRVIIAFLATGNLDQATEDEFSDGLLIRDENEQIKRGEAPQALIFDNHSEHIVNHKKVFSSPEARNNPKLLEVGLAHIQEHMDLMKQVPPDLAAALSGQPLPPPQPIAPPSGPQGQVAGQNVPNIPPSAPEQTQQAFNQHEASMPQKGQ